MCFGGNGPKWKNEVVKDHKFDYIDVREFHDPSFGAKMAYVLMYVMILKSFAVYVADLWTAVSLIVIGDSSINSDASIPPHVAKWIFLGAIIVSFILLFWEILKSKDIIETRDISLAFFSQISNRYYSTKDYSCFCLFRAINDSRKTMDSIAFFVFFTLKSWKKILLAEAPRHVINIVTLITIIPRWIRINNGVEVSNDELGKTYIQRVMTCTMIFSTVIFTISFLTFCAAVIVYIPVLCHIRGNLKEYCCHKVDKRIEQILKKQAHYRVEKHKHAEQRGIKKAGYQQKEELEMHRYPQPTLPNVNMNHPLPHSHGYQSPRPGFQQHPTMSSTSSHFGPGRRNSLTSVYSDQAGLTAYAQPPAYASPYQYNGSQTNLSVYSQPQYQPKPYWSQ
ncbi:hypothetical protein A0J61_01745 [Choanephora cucurbitarum]|uniref:Uncharacterized protein n=1 Tax=Choanephora cucurbitarum TaxID=101091 RepID=A0A1C7NM33_9FUNG|nr:hypothetical protein A0J61_01745 [Choanephora cucurbitarum]